MSEREPYVLSRSDLIGIAGAAMLHYDKLKDVEGTLPPSEDKLRNVAVDIMLLWRERQVVVE